MCCRVNVLCPTFAAINHEVHFNFNLDFSRFKICGVRDDSTTLLDSFYVFCQQLSILAKETCIQPQLSFGTDNHPNLIQHRFTSFRLVGLNFNHSDPLRHPTNTQHTRSDSDESSLKGQNQLEFRKCMAVERTVVPRCITKKQTSNRKEQKPTPKLYPI
jgi:hypothetical protein